MKGCLYYDDIEKIWYVNWLNNVELSPSVSVGGRLKLHPDDVSSYKINEYVSGDEVEYEVINDYAKLIEVGSIYNRPLYSKIEKEIIEWSNDGTKTAGTLTRKIIDIITN